MGLKMDQIAVFVDLKRTTSSKIKKKITVQVPLFQISNGNHFQLNRLVFEKKTKFDITVTFVCSVVDLSELYLMDLKRAAIPGVPW